MAANGHATGLYSKGLQTSAGFWMRKSWHLQKKPENMNKINNSVNKAAQQAANEKYLFLEGVVMV